MAKLATAPDLDSGICNGFGSSSLPWGTKQYCSDGELAYPTGGIIVDVAERSATTSGVR